MQSLEYFGPIDLSEPALFCGFLPEFYFADFFTLSQGFSFVKVKSYTYVQKELFSGLKLINLGEFISNTIQRKSKPDSNPVHLDKHSRT
jgi:hypothetical protein